MEEKLTVIKTNNSPEEKKLEEKEKKKIEEMVGVDKAMKNKKPLMEGNRNLERSCGARRDLQRSQGLGLGISPGGKIGTPEKQKKRKKFGKKVGEMRKLFEYVEVSSLLPARGQKTSLLQLNVTNFAVQVAKPSLKFWTNRKDENKRDPPVLAAQNCAEEGTDQSGQSRQPGPDR